MNILPKKRSDIFMRRLSLYFQDFLLYHSIQIFFSGAVIEMLKRTISVPTFPQKVAELFKLGVAYKIFHHDNNFANKEVTIKRKKTRTSR